MSAKKLIYDAIIRKSSQYPWMETFFITDQEILAASKEKTSKRQIIQAARSLKPVLTLYDTQWYNSKRIRKYAFNSYELAKLVPLERNLNNHQFIKDGLKLFMKL